VSLRGIEEVRAGMKTLLRRFRPLKIQMIKRTRAGGESYWLATAFPPPAVMIDGCRPFKAIVRGYSWVTIPITWRGRDTGTAKLKIKEMGSRYLFICLYVWLEKYFRHRDYRRVQK